MTWISIPFGSPSSRIFWDKSRLLSISHLIFPSSRFRISPEYSWKLLVGEFCQVLQILTLLQPQKCHFPHPFSDLVSKIHTHFQTWLLWNYAISYLYIRTPTKRFLKIHFDLLSLPLPSLLVAQRDLCWVACITGVIFFALFRRAKASAKPNEERRIRATRDGRVGRSLLVSRLPLLLCRLSAEESPPGKLAITWPKTFTM